MAKKVPPAAKKSRADMVTKQTHYAMQYGKNRAEAMAFISKEISGKNSKYYGILCHRFPSTPCFQPFPKLAKLRDLAVGEVLSK